MTLQLTTVKVIREAAPAKKADTVIYIPSPSLIQYFLSVILRLIFVLELQTTIKSYFSSHVKASKSVEIFAQIYQKKVIEKCNKKTLDDIFSSLISIFTLEFNFGRILA